MLLRSEVLQEILDNGVKVENDTVVHVWKWWWPVSLSAEATAGGIATAASTESLSRQRPQPCELSKGCFPNGAQLEAEETPGWVNELQRVVKQACAVHNMSNALVLELYCVDIDGLIHTSWGGIV